MHFKQVQPVSPRVTCLSHDGASLLVFKVGTAIDQLSTRSHSEPCSPNGNHLLSVLAKICAQDVLLHVREDIRHGADFLLAGDATADDGTAGRQRATSGRQTIVDLPIADERGAAVQAWRARPRGPHGLE